MTPARRRGAVRGFVVASLAFLAAILPAPAPRAAAHGTAGQSPTNFEARIERVDPADALGTRVQVRTTDLGQHVEVRAEPAVEVVILGYDAEPYLRITDRGVEQNGRSPAVFMNRDATVTESPPARFDASAAPEWDRISAGRVARWHDHRTHPMGTVGEREGRDGFAWTIDLVVDGRAVAVHGRTRPLDTHAAIWMLIAALVAVASGIAASRARTATLALSGVFLCVAVIAITTARATASTESLGVRAQTALWPFLATLLLTGALVHLWRRGLHRAVPGLLFGFTATAIAVGLALLPWLTHARLPATGPTWVWQTVVAFVLGASTAAAVVCAFALRGSEPAHAQDQREPASAAIRRTM